MKPESPNFLAQLTGSFAMPAAENPTVTMDERLDVDADSLQRHMVVADGIPNPPRTHWIRDAETRGCRVMDGLAMLVSQGSSASNTGLGSTPT